MNRSITTVFNLLKDYPVLIGLGIRLILTFALPILLDDGLILRGVRYTDIDYDVFTDAAEHVANGRSPYDRHTYRYTPFLARLLTLPYQYKGDGILGVILSVRYFGKILFCVADVICGYIIVLLRRRRRGSRNSTDDTNKQCSNKGDKQWMQYIINILTPELKDALWWLYSPLPINICTRGSAESLVVLLPVLATVAIADIYNNNQKQQASVCKAASLKDHMLMRDRIRRRGKLSIMIRACFAGMVHGIGIHAKLYPVIYTISFMANFSRQQQQSEVIRTDKEDEDTGWKYLLSEQNMQFSDTCVCCIPSTVGRSAKSTFPWRHPKQILVLAVFWIQRLLFTMSSILFLVTSMGTVGVLTYLAVYYYGQTALDEGLLYHFQRVDHRHNYSMYWYWIYLARGKAETISSQLASENTASSSAWGFIPLIPQVLILGFSSLSIAPYDLTFALFCQTFAFVSFNKVITAQYFTWYLCLLPLCSDRINWSSKRMFLSLGLLIVSIITWLLSAFTLEMLGWRSHRQVWLASLFFFIANVNLLSSILNGYKKGTATSSQPGKGWTTKTKRS